MALLTLVILSSVPPAPVISEVGSWMLSRPRDTSDRCLLRHASRIHRKHSELPSKVKLWGKRRRTFIRSTCLISTETRQDINSRYEFIKNFQISRLVNCKIAALGVAIFYFHTWNGMQY